MSDTFEFEVQGNYGFGWECLTTEDTRVEADQTKRTYDREEPASPHRVRRVRATT